MSWLFAISKRDHDEQREDQFVHSAPLHTVSMSGVYIAAGGLRETCLFESHPERSNGWVVVGTGIEVAENQARMLAQEDWRELLSHDTFDPARIDGHFALLRWDRNYVECFTDQLGLRTIYFSDCDFGVCLSTRLDWVTRTSGKNQLNVAALGSRWLMFNQISYESCVDGVGRLGPGGYASVRKGSVVACHSIPWLPSFDQRSAFSLDVLRPLVQSALEQPRILSLGLSGGLDSRLLLAMLTHSGSRGFGTHTFGHPTDPDVRIAGEIAGTLGLRHQSYHEPLPESQTCWSLIRSFVTQTMLSEPVSSWLKLRYYSALHRDGKLMIDGGFGEIARRQYLNRVMWLGRSALRSRDSSRLFALMRSPRSECFSPEIHRQMVRGACRELEMALEEMPPIGDIGAANFVDLFAVRTRVPNWGGGEQARLDGDVVSFMPLVQPTFLRSIFMVPVTARANGKAYYETIRRLNPTLGQFPMVKSGHTYPFGASSHAAWFIAKLKSRIGGSFADPGPDRLLTHLRENVLDVIHSTDVRANAIYDFRKIESMAEGYYRGELRLRGSLEWWLTFEIWRSSLLPAAGNRLG
jgi:hypothetical protein